MNLVVIAYSLAPGPGGPEGQVNKRLCEALRSFWKGNVTIIGAGGISEQSKDFRVINTEDYKSGTLMDHVLEFASSRKSFLAKVLDRACYSVSFRDAKRMLFERKVKKIVGAIPGTVLIYSRMLPFESVYAIHSLVKKRKSIWLVNVNDPFPPTLLPGLYAFDKKRAKWQEKQFKKVLPFISAFTFPCNQLRMMQIKKFPEIQQKAQMIIPHIIPEKEEREKRKGRLRLAFAGTLRLKRINPYFIDALKAFCKQHPKDAKHLECYVYLARKNVYEEAFIKQFPIQTKIFEECFSDDVDKRLRDADVCIDFQSKEDKALLLTKIVNYASREKPIWVIGEKGGTAWNLVERNNIGYVSQKEEVQEIVNALKEIVQDWKQGRKWDFEKIKRRCSAHTCVSTLQQLANNVDKTGLQNESWP